MTTKSDPNVQSIYCIIFEYCGQKRAQGRVPVDPMSLESLISILLFLFNSVTFFSGNFLEISEKVMFRKIIWPHLDIILCTSLIVNVYLVTPGFHLGFFRVRTKTFKNSSHLGIL